MAQRRSLSGRSPFCQLKLSERSQIHWKSFSTKATNLKRTTKQNHQPLCSLPDSAGEGGWSLFLGRLVGNAESTHVNRQGEGNACSIGWKMLQIFKRIKLWLFATSTTEAPLRWNRFFQQLADPKTALQPWTEMHLPMFKNEERRCTPCPQFQCCWKQPQQSHHPKQKTHPYQKSTHVHNTEIRRGAGRLVILHYNVWPSLLKNCLIVITEP